MLCSRYQSPRSGRFSTDSLPSSYGSEGTHTLGVLRRPKDRRKGGSGSFVQQAGLQIRTEGFDTGGSAFGSAAQLQPQSAIDQEPKGSPAKQPGLLSRTFSSRTDSAALKVSQDFTIHLAGSITDVVRSASEVGSCLAYAGHLNCRKS